MLTDLHAVVHANRLKFYADSQLNVTETLRETIAHNNVHCKKVECLLDLRRNADTGLFEVKCKWVGFDDEEPTWEPFGNMVEDIPKMLEAFLSKFHDKDLVAAARATV